MMYRIAPLVSSKRSPFSATFLGSLSSTALLTLLHSDCSLIRYGMNLLFVGFCVTGCIWQQSFLYAVLYRFSVAAPEARNRLPMELKLLRSAASFRVTKLDIKSVLSKDFWFCGAYGVESTVTV